MSGNSAQIRYKVSIVKMHAAITSFTFYFRAMVGGNSGPATSVDASSIVEALCVKLEAATPSPKKQQGKNTSRWRFILDKYQTHQEPRHSP